MLISCETEAVLYTLLESDLFLSFTHLRRLAVIRSIHYRRARYAKVHLQITIR